ncbi:MBL fold metallo-hydrolase [Protofrankia symbiont of Coriaria ruscifolia]|uniref:MBL fold metallo-hydrolase n=1 Tax=Protofrankia symbiont of Coriaria ruscifolia TaxID=1306542 RepID=UPI001040F87A|nr:MBL fold metallo-hydrolase [Protofrankia symbiont of Coriaria ruscifolia]
MDVTWWGHSTVVISDAGTRLVTDPVFGTRIAHLRRRAGARPATEATQVDAAVVSHLHADHLDIPSLKLLPPTAPIILPRGGAALLARRHPALAERCVEMVPGDRVRVTSRDGGAGRIGATGGGDGDRGGLDRGDHDGGDHDGGVDAAAGLDVLAVPAEHDGSRGPWSRHRGPALGFVVTGTRTVWFAGDTALHDAMADLVPLGLDLALVPVGGWGPNLGPGHLDPAGAVEAVRRTLRPRPVPPPLVSARPAPVQTGRSTGPAPVAGPPAVAVPIHYGTFWPIGFDRVRPDRFHEPGREFARLAGAADLSAQVRVLAHGESMAVPVAGPFAVGPASPGRASRLATETVPPRDMSLPWDVPLPRDVPPA